MTRPIRKKRLLWLGCIAMLGCLPLASFVGCGSPQSQSEKSSSDSSSAQAVSWSPDMDCSMCHSEQQSSLADTACLGGKHKDLECSSCHTDTDGLAKAHENASESYTGKALKKTSVEEQACLSCHGSWDELAEKTAALTVLTDSKGTVVNPHEVTNVTTINKSGQHESITCTTCHTAHESGDASTTAQQECLSCHHQNVYECYTCHS